jgi:hypothetical protein
MKVRPTSGSKQFTMMALRPAICSVVVMLFFWGTLNSAFDSHKLGFPLADYHEVID